MTAAQEFCAPGTGARAGGRRGHNPSTILHVRRERSQCAVRGRHGRRLAGAEQAGPPSAPATTGSGDTTSRTTLSNARSIAPPSAAKQLPGIACCSAPSAQNRCLALPAAPPSAAAIVGDKVDRQAKRSEYFRYPWNMELITLLQMLNNFILSAFLSLY